MASGRVLAGLVVAELVLSAAVAGPVVAAGSGGGTTTRVSVSSTGAQQESAFGSPSGLSADGRFAVFVSGAGNLVAGDSNGRDDVFVRDREARTTERVSVSSSGVPGDRGGTRASVSQTGRLIAFASTSTRLVAGDTNAASDVFVRDLTEGTTRRVSLTSEERQGRGSSDYPAVSAQGRFVAFTSDAPDLVAGDTNGVTDVFVRDLQAGTTSRVSVATGGAQAAGATVAGVAPAISADGRYVAFLSYASNLVAGDTNGQSDVFVRDRQAGTTSRVSLTSGGRQTSGTSGDVALSADGRYVAFASEADDLVPGDTNYSADVFVRDRQAGTTSRVSVSSSGTEGIWDSLLSGISADGRRVAFTSSADNLVPGDTNGGEWTSGEDVFVRDRQAGTNVRVNVATAGAQANRDSYDAAISPDGQHVLFTSDATNLVAGDTNDSTDAFVHDLAAPTVTADGKYAVLSGAGEVPGPGDRDGRGVAIIDTYLADGALTGRVCAQFSATGLGPSPRTAAHLHEGPAGMAGPIVLDLTAALLGGPTCLGGVPYDLIRAIRTHPGRYYINVHTQQFPAGAVRGQLRG